MSQVEMINISKAFPSTIKGEQCLLVVDKFSLKISEGELVTVFGPNGCGKSTILNILAGTIEPDEGKVLWNKENFNSLPIGYVFQNYADTLLPWRSVRDNIAFPLELKKLNKQERADKVNKRMEQFRLAEHADKFIYQLSGGLKQLVSIARSTVYDPPLLLLDEPFSALDYSLSRMLWTRFREFWTDLKVTTVFISHNIDEAIFLGDRVIVLTQRPSQVVEDIQVPFGKNRGLDLLSSQEFFSVRKTILEAFEQGRTI